jgi:hypothetical protein
MGRSKEMQVRLAPALPLEMCGLTKTFRSGRIRAVALRRTGDGLQHTAVDDVSFVVRPGEVYGVLRGAIISGQGFGPQAGNLAVLAIFGLVMVPGSLLAFGAAERWAKKTGRLKRQG